MKTLTTGFLALTLAAISLTGCSDDPSPITGATDTTEEPAAPAVPPPSALAFDFSLFDTPETRGYFENPGDLARADAAGRLNWINAAVRVLYIDLVLADALTPPAAVLAIALHQPPTYQGAGTWLWAFDHTDDTGVEVSVRLYGTIDTVAEIATWEMVVSSNEEEPPLVDFLWFEGQTSLVDDAGFLVFHERDDRPVARVSWELEGEARSFDFENIDPLSEDEGDFVRQSVDGTHVEVRFHDESTGIDSVIEWDEHTHEGSITAPDYNDGERACWDEHLFDTECPVEAS